MIMKQNWVCKQCGLYQKVDPNRIKAGQRVYFYKNIAYREANQMINVDIVRGVVLRRNDDFITILSGSGVSRVKAVDVHPEDVPTNFVYNKFGSCDC